MATATTETRTTASRSETSSTEATRYVLDGAHSHVSFSVRHMMIANVRGEFQNVTGEVTYNAARPDATRITASIGAASINTREEKRDAHLRSADFLDVENHPAIVFASKKARAKGDGLEVTGDLTIRGTTREVILVVDEITAEHTDPWGNLRIGATAKTKIRRSEFGMVWNAALEAGGVLVGDEVSIQLETELIKQK